MMITPPERARSPAFRCALRTSGFTHLDLVVKKRAVVRWHANSPAGCPGEFLIKSGLGATFSMACHFCGYSGDATQLEIAPNHLLDF